MTFADYLRQNKNIVSCPSCKEKLWEYSGNYSGVIQSSDFKSINKKVSDPQNGQKMICPLCGEILVSDPQGGSL